MTLYVVNVWTRKAKRGGGYVDGDLWKEEIVVDNLETAKSIFKSFMQEFKYETMYGFFGAVELFIPKISEYGRLSSFPGGGHDHEYIMLYKKTHSGEIIERGLSKE